MYLNLPDLEEAVGDGGGERGGDGDEVVEVKKRVLGQGASMEALWEWRWTNEGIDLLANERADDEDLASCLTS